MYINIHIFIYIYIYTYIYIYIYHIISYHIMQKKCPNCAYNTNIIQVLKIKITIRQILGRPQNSKAEDGF